MSRKHLALYLIFFSSFPGSHACSSPTNKANDDEFGGTTPGEYTAEEPDTERKVIYSAYLSVTVTMWTRLSRTWMPNKPGGYILNLTATTTKNTTASITTASPRPPEFCLRPLPWRVSTENRHH